MKKQILIITSVLAIAIANSFGGESYSGVECKSLVDEIDCCPEGCDIGFSASIGYETDYLFRGFRFAEDSAWLDLSYSVGDFTVGVWGLYELNNGPNSLFNNETDLYVSYTLPSILGFDAEIGYTYFDLPGARASHEPYASVSRDLGFASVGWFSAYELNLEWYHEASISKSIAINDKLGIDLSGGVGYYDSPVSSGIGRGVSHYYVNAGLPLALNCRTTLTPYIGWTDSDSGGPIGNNADAVTGFSTGVDTLHGGISLSVEF